MVHVRCKSESRRRRLVQNTWFKLAILIKKRASVRAPRTEEELSLHNGQQAVARAACERGGRFAGGRNCT